MSEKRKLKVQIVTRQVTELTLAEWQADEQLTNQGRKLLNIPEFQLMLSVLRNEHPGMIVEDHHNWSLEMRAILQARAEGYSMCLANIEAMGKSKFIAMPPDATFETEELPVDK